MLIQTKFFRKFLTIFDGKKTKKLTKIVKFFPADAGSKFQIVHICCTYTGGVRGSAKSRDCAHFVHIAREGEWSRRLEPVSGQRIGFGRRIKNISIRLLKLMFLV